MRRILPSAPARLRQLPTMMRYIGPYAPDESLDVTLVLRRRRPLVLPLPPSERADFAASHGADPTDVERLRAFGATCGVQGLGCDLACRTLHWRGSVKARQKAFDVLLGRCQLLPDGPTFIGCNQPPVLPDPAVNAALGLDRRPVAYPHFRIARANRMWLTRRCRSASFTIFPPAMVPARTSQSSSSAAAISRAIPMLAARA